MNHVSNARNRYSILFNLIDLIDFIAHLWLWSRSLPRNHFGWPLDEVYFECIPSCQGQSSFQSIDWFQSLLLFHPFFLPDQPSFPPTRPSRRFQSIDLQSSFNEVSIKFQSSLIKFNLISRFRRFYCWPAEFSSSRCLGRCLSSPRDLDGQATFLHNSRGKHGRGGVGGTDS